MCWHLEAGSLGVDWVMTIQPSLKSAQTAPSSLTSCGDREKACRLWTRRWASPPTDQPAPPSWISQPPELWERNLCYYKPPPLPCSVTAALRLLTAFKIKSERVRLSLALSGHPDLPPADPSSHQSPLSTSSSHVKNAPVLRTCPAFLLLTLSDPFARTVL